MPPLMNDVSTENANVSVITFPLKGATKRYALDEELEHFDAPFERRTKR
jgi:hypothetical protein